MDTLETQRWLNELRQAVSTRVTASIAELAESHADIGPEVADLFTISTGLLSGGKRLRAAFAAAGWTAFGGAELAGPVVRAGAGLELFQMAALVHDDIIDASTTRRGMPAAHRQLALRHGELGMDGDADRFGESGALLLGDLLLVAAQQEVERGLDVLPSPADRRGRSILLTMMAEVTVGQYLDIYAQAAPWSEDPAVDLDRARRVIRAKSASYSVQQPLRLGAAMAGADDAGLAACAAFGLPIGEAFQLRDDMLGVFGDPDLTGKPAGDDLREGKRTVLVASAMTRASTAQRAVLQQALGNAQLQPDEIDQVREILYATGADHEVEALIAERVAEGLGVLDAAAVSPQADAVLRSLVRAAVSRTS
ncbi:polyprenyl synthetase family protein [Ruania zhangjianzhongii]|uniref:polyprenyl synthetase family protein n=1 Tax=Ruania zhangjianzhongii TaxID=2603206 RepID=UPI00143D0F5D|nr:polyprenyl synthetase family protein [Ruania zhangjianzhongii]